MLSASNVENERGKSGEHFETPSLFIFELEEDESPITSHKARR